MSSYLTVVGVLAGFAAVIILSGIIVAAFPYILMLAIILAVLGACLRGILGEKPPKPGKPPKPPKVVPPGGRW